MDKIKQIKQHADYLRLTLLRNQAEHLIHHAQIDKPTYQDYTFDLLEKKRCYSVRNQTLIGV